MNDMTVALSEKLQRTENYCLRYVYDVRRDQHITPYYIQGYILKLKEQQSIKILNLVHSILQSGFPKYFSNYFQFISHDSVRSTRSGSRTLRMPQHRTVVFDRSFQVMGCRLWNSLPPEITSIEGDRRFVAALRRLYHEWLVGAGPS
ncbi:hypothetical protein J6590_108535 [Homalodisca vitripennis]|nr:hypothetical protein J6590_108535 [Homalodisca vitripennis]